MTKEKLASLEKYLAKHKDLLANPPSADKATKEYKFWLAKEIKMTSDKIESAKMAGLSK